MEIRAYLKLFSVTIPITMDQAKQLIKDQYKAEAPKIIVSKLYEYEEVPIPINHPMSDPIGVVYLLPGDGTTGKGPKPSLIPRKEPGKAA